jgi:hypothetical protein
MAQTLLTVIGTILSLVGTGCAVVAYRSTWSEHGDGPLLPQVAGWMARAQNRVHQLLGKPRTRVVALSGVAEIGMSGSARLVVSGPAIPDDADIEQQIALLIRRVENLERQATDDRDHATREVRAVRDVIDKTAAEAVQASAQVEAKAKAMVLDSIRIQLVGLGLVGVGTAFLAVAGFMS